MYNINVGIVLFYTSFQSTMLYFNPLVSVLHVQGSAVKLAMINMQDALRLSNYDFWPVYGETVARWFSSGTKNITYVS